MSVKERTSTGHSGQGALRLKHRRPERAFSMSAKPSNQTAGPPFAISQVEPEVQGSPVLAASLAPVGHPLAAHSAAQVMAAQPILLRLPMVMRITGLARSTIYKLISLNQFPVPIKLSKRAVAWLRSEIESWVSTRARTH